MSKSTTLPFRGLSYSRSLSTSSTPPILKISNGSFYRQHPSSSNVASNPVLFSNLNFVLPSTSAGSGHWAVLGPSSSGKTTFLQILRGKTLCIPPAARSFPYLNSDAIRGTDSRLRNPSTAIQYVGFGGEQGGLGGQGARGAYLSARYEARREETDFSVLNYLQGKTELNAAVESKENIDSAALQRVIIDLRLQELIDMPVANLSNGQTRRAKIARAILGRPEVLLLDEPFMGLDPPTLMSLSPLLQRLADASAPRLVLSLRSQDPIPDWITHLVYLKPGCQIAFMGKKEDVLNNLGNHATKAADGTHDSSLHLPVHSLHEIGRVLSKYGISDSILDTKHSHSHDNGSVHRQQSSTSDGEPLIEMAGVQVRYGSKLVLGGWTQVASRSSDTNASSLSQMDSALNPGLHWTIRRGQRWGIFGPNGSGKTTLLSLICSDHPKTYSLPIKLFGRYRTPESGRPGISIFDIQKRIGHSSPEIHNFMPRGLSVRAVLENAWADTFASKPQIDEGRTAAVDACLRWFEPELRPDSRQQGAEIGNSNMRSTSWADGVVFGGMPFSAQRIALFLRAVIKKPDLVILDEAFSGMDDIVRDKCMHFLEHGETGSFVSAAEHTITGLEEHQALLCISHVKEEVPACVREWICLPETGTALPARFGRLDGPLEASWKQWGEVWGA